MEKHRLSAIMFTDIVGYTRKMEADEVRMLRLLDDHCRMVESAASSHDGEIVKKIGDAFLVNFDSALNAVLCAIDIQQAHQEYNQDKTEPDQVQLRIGIHLGDIVIREGDVFGDGVNVASRVQPLAEPGGICVTRAVYDIVKRKMAIKAVELGPQQLKNVDEAIEVFHLLSGTVGVRDIHRKRPAWRRRKWLIPALSPAVLLIAVAVFLWQRGFFASGAMGAIARLTWNANAPKNSVAILPLRNLTGKSELQYICEGFSQDLIYRLTAARDVYVYPMENVMALDENQRTFQRIKANLGAKYLITGAVELAGDSLRVEIEMVETSAGNRVFNEQYTTLPLNRLGIQERVAKEVLYQMAGRSSENVMGIWWSQLSQNPIATDLYQQAYSMTGSNSFDIFFLSKEQRDSSITLLTKALSADSSFVMARVLLAYMLTNYDLDLPDTDSLGKEQAKRKAIESAESVVRLAPDVPETHLCLGAILRNYDQGNHAETELLRAIQLRPTYPAAWYELGWLYSSEAEKKTEASAALNRALQLYEEIGDWRRQSEVLHFIALNYRGMKDNRSAMDYWMKQYELRSKRSTDSFADQIALMFAAYQIAYFSGEDRDYAQGKTYYEIAIDVLSRTLKNKPIPKDRSDPDCQWFAFLIEHQHTLADFEFKLGELPSALKHCQDAQQTINVIGKAIGEDPPDYPEYIEDLPAKIRYLQRDFESAFKCNDSCIEHYSVSHDSTDWSNSLVTRGSIFRAKDEFDSAWACLRDANAIAGGDTTARRTILLQSAITSVQMGDYIRAADSLRFVGAFNDRETNERLRFQFFSGAVASMTGNPDSGLKQMLAANDSTVVYADRVEACRVLAQVLTEVGRHKEARKYLTQGRKLAETAGMKGELKRYDALAAKNGH